MYPSEMDITSFISITMFCWTNNIIHNIPHIHIECEEYFVGLTMFCKIFFTFNLNVKIFCIRLSVPLNIVMALNNVMDFFPYSTIILGKLKNFFH